jgi:hypothetical protein
MVTMLSLVHGFLNGIARLRDGRENLEDDKHSGQSTAIQTSDMIKKVWESISTDH